MTKILLYISACISLIIAILVGINDFDSTKNFNKRVPKDSIEFSEEIYKCLHLPENQGKSYQEIVQKYLSMYDYPSSISYSRPEERETLLDYEIADSQTYSEEEYKKERQETIANIHKEVIKYQRNPYPSAFLRATIGLVLTFFTVYIIGYAIPIIWKFFLRRVSEISLAIRGKYN